MCVCFHFFQAYALLLALTLSMMYGEMDLPLVIVVDHMANVSAVLTEKSRPQLRCRCVILEIGCWFFP